MTPTKRLRYPIGMQTFSNIIEDGYTYVDKTGFIPTLLDHGKFIFLSRPRRFGKSLLLSTLEAYFEGRRELFKGLALDDMDVDWTPSPVFRFDFTSEDYSQEDGLKQRLNILLMRLEEKYGRNPELSSPSTRLNYLIEAAYLQTGRRVVILVDEYDKPLLDIEDMPEIFEKNQRILKSFYGNLKSMDSMIHFAFITGVARFSKVSIFSDLNNLDDISMEDDFADVCGWTEEELIGTFSQGIRTLAEKREEDFDTTLSKMRNYYDGYKFTSRGSHLYNPFSVLRALKAKEIDPYWFETGSPTFLVRRVKGLGIYPPDINGVQYAKSDLIAVGLNDNDPIPLMFQTGYLTIDSYDRDSELYKLRFPNYEVESGFYKNLLPLYAPETKMSDSPFSYSKFKIDLHEGRPEDFMKRLSSLLKDIPGEDHRESTYRAITYLVATLCNTQAIAEHHGYKGRSDIEVITRRYIYLFEFKYNKSVEEAMDQIHSRDYAGRYAIDGRALYLIGANFNENKDERGLEYIIEEVDK